VLHRHDGVRLGEADTNGRGASAARTSRSRAATARASCPRAIALYGLARTARAAPRSTRPRPRRAGEDHVRRRRRDAAKRPALAQKLGLKITAHAIFQPSSNSTFKALSREAKNQDGKNIHVAVVDELHAHPTRDVWDVVITGAGEAAAVARSGRSPPRASTPSGICYEVRDGVVKMLEGAENEQLFGIIYTIDEGDDWKDESELDQGEPQLARVDRSRRSSAWTRPRRCRPPRKRTTSRRSTSTSGATPTSRGCR
jgi:hypothetical protein